DEFNRLARITLSLSDNTADPPPLVMGGSPDPPIATTAGLLFTGLGPIGDLRSAECGVGDPRTPTKRKPLPRPMGQSCARGRSAGLVSLEPATIFQPHCPPSHGLRWRLDIVYVSSQTKTRAAGAGI